MAFPGQNYVPPGTYVTTRFDSPVAGSLDTLKIPIFIGEGNEILTETNFELPRGSSATIDQQITLEDATGRAVVAELASGDVTLGDFDGTIRKFQVRNFPIVTGDGTGTTSNNRSDVQVTLNGQEIVVGGVDGANGIVELVQAPNATDQILVTYFFNRTDTFQTDDVSDQVTAESATVYASSGISDVDAQNAGTEVLSFVADVLDAEGNVTVPGNNVFEVTVDGTAGSVTIPANDYTVAQVASILSSAGLGLTASRFDNEFGQSAFLLTADQSILVGDGTANGLLGFVEGDGSARNRVFYVFNGPIVDGTNGGITTTDTSKVTVTVDNVAVTPESVNGQTRAVTLTTPPEAGAEVLISYYHNTWQDTFDYLGDPDVTSIVRVGDVPDQTSYIQESDYVLRDDKIVWGTAVLVSTGVSTTGFGLFGESQITATLIDNRVFMQETTPVVTATSGVSVDTRTKFLLPDQPTLGNGRDTPLGQSLFQTLSNSRIDVPTNRPDVVQAYWGYSVNDALDRGEVAVTQVEGSTITLASPVPAGATVYATYFKNLLTDQEYTLTVDNAGVSGVGSYTITNEAGNAVLTPQFSVASKGAGLTGIDIAWPSGSERSSDVHFESVTGASFTGPVEETVTVQFASREATPAIYAVDGSGPYEFIENQSDRAAVKIDGATLAYGAAGLDLGDPSTHAHGFFAELISDPIDYTGGASATVGETYDLTTAEALNIVIDDVQVAVSVDSITNVTVQHFVDHINEAASGHQGTTAGVGTTTTAILEAAERSSQDDYYIGWEIVIGDGSLAAGESATVTDYDAGTGTVTFTPAVSNPVLATEEYYIYDPDHQAQYVAATQFDGPVIITAGEYDDLTFAYVGDTSGGIATSELTLTPATYATPALLAAEVQTQLDANVATAVGGDATLEGLKIYCEADSSNRLVFKLRLPGVDSSGYLTFLTDATPGEDFAILAGISTGASASGAQAKLVQGPVARRYTPSTASTKKFHDRLVVRNRLVPGGPAASLSYKHFVDQMEIVANSGSGNTKTGLETGDFGLGHSVAHVDKASILGRVGFTNGQIATGTHGDARDGQPEVIFYSGAGVVAANDELIFNVDGEPVTVSFTSTASGTSTPLGPVTEATTVLGQIAAALAALPDTPFGSLANLRDTLEMVREEGAGIRLTSAGNDSLSKIVIGAGSANTTLGFTEGDVAERDLVEPKVLASAFNSHRESTLADWVLDPTSTDNTYFADEALASVETDATGNEFLRIESRVLGTASSVEWAAASSADTLAPGTGLNVTAGDGESGEAALDGFFVTSDNPNGSGSANDSVLNNGTGQDGIVGQTYFDDVTGLTFTVLPRGFQSNPSGPFLSYPTGATAIFRFTVRETVVTDANLPHNALAGVELTVANTSNLNAGDTAIVEAFDRGGNEPAVGDIYYVTYEYLKPTFGTQFFTKISAIEDNYGSVSPDAPLSLAASLAIVNGAALLGLHQVQKDEGSSFASLTSFRDAIDDLEGALPGQVNPDMILPLRGDSTELFQYLSASNDKMSSIRFQSERTSIIGVQSGTSPEAAGDLAQTLQNTRMRLVYPDAAIVTVLDALGSSQEYLVDGPFVAAGMAGSVVSPSVDVATPWTNRRLVGYTRLGRRLSRVEANTLAQKGVTVLEETPPVLKVRQGLTTDMSDILHKLPTIVMIADEVQRQSRSVLDRFIGIKFLPGVTAAVEGRLSMLLKQLVAEQIVFAYTGIEAVPADDDPTVLEVEAAYSPVFPLLYIVIQFNLRTTLA